MLMLEEGLALQTMKKFFGPESGEEIYREIREDLGLLEAEICVELFVEPVENQIKRLRAAKMRIFGF